MGTEEYQPDEIDITQWKPQVNDKFLLSLTKVGIDLWKGELYKTYGLYYKAFIDDKKVQELLKFGWELKKK